MISKAKKTKVIKLFEKGMSKADIARELEISRNTVSKIISDFLRDSQGSGTKRESEVVAKAEELQKNKVVEAESEEEDEKSMDTLILDGAKDRYVKKATLVLSDELLNFFVENIDVAKELHYLWGKYKPYADAMHMSFANLISVALEYYITRKQSENELLLSKLLDIIERKSHEAIQAQRYVEQQRLYKFLILLHQLRS